MNVLIMGDHQVFAQVSETYQVTYDPGEQVDIVVSSVSSVQYAPEGVPIIILASGGIGDWSAKKSRPDAIMCKSIDEIIAEIEKTSVTTIDVPEIQVQDSLVILSYANKGGVGKTTVACSLASILARSGLSTVLLDFDFGGPDVATFFGLKLKAQNFLERSDVSTLLVSPCENLYVLPTPKGLNPSGISPKQLIEIILQLKERFSVVIVDTCPAPWQEEYMHPIFAMADLVYAVVNQSKFSLEETKEYAPQLLAMGVGPERINIILNQFTPKLANQKAVEQAFCSGFKKDVRRLPTVKAIIPEGWEQQIRALNKGIVLHPEEWKKLREEIWIRLASGSLPQIDNKPNNFKKIKEGIWKRWRKI